MNTPAAPLVDVLAPTFGGRRDSLRALKVAAYSNTPVWLAGVLYLLPAVGLWVLVAALYAAYLLCLGLPVLMQCPKEKAISYTVVIAVCAFAVSGIVAALGGVVIGG